MNLPFPDQMDELHIDMTQPQKNELLFLFYLQNKYICPFGKLK